MTSAMDIYEENIQRLNRLRKRLFKLEARPYDVEKATLSSQLQAAVKLYSESLEQQAALKAVLRHYSSAQSQESEQDLLRDIWNAEDPALEQQLASRRHLHLVQQIIDLRANYEAEKAARVSVERDLKVAQEMLVDSQKEVDELRALLAENAAASVALMTEPGRGSPSPLRSRSPLFPAEGDADSEIATAKKLIRDHIRSVIPTDRTVSSPTAYTLTQAVSPPIAVHATSGSGLPPKNPTTLLSRRKHYSDGPSPGPPPPPPPDDTDFGEMEEGDGLPNLATSHRAHRHHENNAPRRKIIPPSAATPIHSGVREPLPATGVELDIDLGQGVSDSIFVDQSSDVKRLATDFLRNHNLPAATYFSPLLSFLSSTQESLSASAAPGYETGPAPPVIDYSGSESSSGIDPSSSPDYNSGSKAPPYRSPPPPPPSTSSSPPPIAAQSPSSSRDGVRKSPQSKQTDLRLLPVLDKPLSKQRSAQSPQRISESFEVSPALDRDGDGGHRWAHNDSETRRLRNASIREQVGMYTKQLQAAEDRLGHHDGFETGANPEIEDRREKLFQAVHTFDKAALCNERNQYNQAIKLYRQSIDLFESAGFSEQGMEMVKEEVEYWTRKLARYKYFRIPNVCTDTFVLQQ